MHNMLWYFQAVFESLSLAKSDANANSMVLGCDLAQVGATWCKYV